MLLKIVVVGDSGVGKTNIISRYADDRFIENTKNTIGVDFSSHRIGIDGNEIDVQFWDTAGQEKYRAMATGCYRKAKGAVVVYDITSIESFYNCGRWLEELQLYSTEKLIPLLLGNKIDLSERQVGTDIAEKFAKENNMEFEEVSAKLNQDGQIQRCIERYIKLLVRGVDTHNELAELQQDIQLRQDTKRVSKSNVVEVESTKKSCC